MIPRNENAGNIGIIIFSIQDGSLYRTLIRQTSHHESAQILRVFVCVCLGADNANSIRFQHVALSVSLGEGSNKAQETMFGDIYRKPRKHTIRT